MSGDNNKIPHWNVLDVRGVNPEQAEFTHLHYHNGEEAQTTAKPAIAGGTMAMTVVARLSNLVSPQLKN